MHTMLGHFEYAFVRHATFEKKFQISESTDLAFIDEYLFDVASMDHEAMLIDPDFRIAVEKHLAIQTSRLLNIRVSLSKIKQIQDLIEQDLGTRTF